ncbi:MAG: ABC transporter ATP-binding protein, partial [Sulfurovum sp.]
MSQTHCTIKGIIQQILARKKEVIWGNIVAITATLLVVLTPLFIPILVDELLLGKEHNFIAWISKNILTTDTKGYVFLVLGIIILLRILSTFLSILQTKIFVSISKNITYHMRTSLLNHLKRVSLKEYEMMHVGAVTSKLVTDIETIDGFISSTISKFIV